MLGFVTNAFFKEPPSGLSQAEFNWYVTRQLTQPSASNNDLVELLISYDLINENDPQGEVLRAWIKQEYPKSLNADENTQTSENPSVLNAFQRFLRKGEQQLSKEKVSPEKYFRLK